MRNFNINKRYSSVLLVIAVVSLTGCNALNRMSEVGAPPKLSNIENPKDAHDYQPVTMPMPDPVSAAPKINSLWRHGARAFFKDQRANQVGDILTVNVTIKDKALLQNKSEQKRGKDTDSAKINALGGLENNLSVILPESVNPANLIDIETSRSNVGDGTINRNEEIDITFAAIVTQILPNGNLVINGSQEVRVNFELRQLVMSGIIRRSDITSKNTVESSKIAELRIAYGGRGTISDVQQPRYGRQILDIIMPF